MDGLCQRTVVCLWVVNGNTLTAEQVYLMTGFIGQLTILWQYHHAVADTIRQHDTTIPDGHTVQQGIGGEGIKIVTLREVGQLMSENTGWNIVA